MSRTRMDELHEKLWYPLLDIINSGYSIKEFREAAREVWLDVLRDKIKYVSSEFDEELE